MTDTERIAELENVLVAAHTLFADCYMKETTPDEIRRNRAFLKFDRKMRELRLIGPNKK